MRRSAEDGGVIVSGLLRTVAWLGLFCVLAFDAGGIITNRVLLDEATRVAAAHAASAVTDALGRRAQTGIAVNEGRAAAESSLTDQPGVTLLDVRLENGAVVVTTARRARVLVAHVLPPLKDQIHAEATASSSLAP